jgi:peptidoglycan hydrolase-like protein with peptidoglycan-binding domain
MRLLLIVVSAALVCAPALGAAAAPRAPQTSSSTSAKPSKPAKHKSKHHSSRQASQKAPTADRITEIQSALARDGYYQGQPNGKWDSNTVAALQRFQSAKGIEANGKLDAPTLQKLGLGSDIAGVSAPKPIPPPSCCSTTPAAPPSSQISPPAAGSSATSASEQAPQH